MPKVDVSQSDHLSFQPFVGTQFVILLEEGNLPIKLDGIKLFEAAQMRAHAVVADGKEIAPRQPFALTWEGPLQPELPSGTYRVVHPEAGEMVLYLSPFHREPEAMLYESVFS